MKCTTKYDKNCFVKINIKLCKRSSHNIQLAGFILDLKKGKALKVNKGTFKKKGALFFALPPPPGLQAAS